MRAGLLLAAMLAMATPQVSWGAVEASLSSRDTIVLAASGSGQAQISRAVAKTDKTPGSAWAVPPAASILFAPSTALDYALDTRPDPPNVPFDGPPLAPRPPPAC